MKRFNSQTFILIGATLFVLYLAGALFVVVADLLARTLAAPTELPLGVLTALAGAPFFLTLLRRAGRAYQW